MQFVVLREDRQARSAFVFRILSSVENTSLLGEGLAGAKTDSAAGNGIHRGDTAGCWTTSPLRTTGCVKEPGPTMLRVVSAPPFGICVRNVLPRTHVSPLESSRSANYLSFAVQLGELLHRIFVSDNRARRSFRSLTAFVYPRLPRRKGRSSLGTVPTGEWSRRWTTLGWADCSSVLRIRRQLEPSFSWLLDAPTGEVRLHAAVDSRFKAT
jgi:hypothetical protein